jgi:biopolymer transport protein ExbB/TolQ
MSEQGSDEVQDVYEAGLLTKLVDQPILWGLAATFAFFAALPALPDGHREFAMRYFAGHWIEYVETGLFFVGMALLVRKFAVIRRERRAIRLVQQAAAGQPPFHVSLPRTLYTALPRSLRQTVVAERLRDAADHLAVPQSPGPLGEALQHLADLAAERLHVSYALHRNICWAIPILGFLGTVMGITLAIAEIDPEQLSGSLNEVTSGLAVAFDTTALALGLSLVLVFTGFAVERTEATVLEHVETFSRKRLAPLGAASATSPLVAAEAHLAGELVTRTDAMIRSQTEAWQGAIESMRRRWADTLIEQQGQLSESLAAGMELTLTDHAAGLKAAREELVSAVSACTDRLDRTLTTTSRERARQLEAFSADLRSLWDRCRGDLDDMQDRYQKTLSEAVTAVGSDLRAWREELRSSAETTRDQRGEMNRQSELLLRVSEQSVEMSRLETRLNENLESLRAAETLQEAVHSLTAATHLLTARATPWTRAA